MKIRFLCDLASAMICVGIGCFMDWLFDGYVNSGPGVCLFFGTATVIYRIKAGLDPIYPIDGAG